MKSQELRARNRVHEIVKLYLSESLNEYILEKIIYTDFLYLSNKTCRCEGNIQLREKYSPVSLNIRIKDIYNWNNWRNTKLYQARRVFLELHPDVQPLNMNNYLSSNLFEESNDIIKKIVRTCKL